VTPPVLTHPDPTKPMEIHPHASAYGIGALLVQRDEEKERPLAYASRLLCRSEENYSITEKECLALVWAVKKFRPFIWGQPIKVVTDHHAICWLFSKKDLAG
jgi:RNase H-like domain found in reverse transcriptase